MPHYQLTALTLKGGVYRAHYSDDTSLIISRTEAGELSTTYNVRIKKN